MARHIRFFMAPEDERQFLGELAPFEITIWPQLVPADHEGLKASAALAGTLTEPLYYLALEQLGPVLANKIKRGPDRGLWRVDEVKSAVIQWERSILDEDGQLRAGRIWAELKNSGDTLRRVQKNVRFEGIFRKLEESIKKRARRSDPVGFFVLPHAARLAGEGLVMREDGRKGGIVRPSR